MEVSDDYGGTALPRGRLTVPLLSVNSTMFTKWDDVHPYTRAIVEEAAKYSGKAVSIEIKGSVHLSQSDVPILFDRTLLALPFSAYRSMLEDAWT